MVELVVDLVKFQAQLQLCAHFFHVDNDSNVACLFIKAIFDFVDGVLEFVDFLSQFLQGVNHVFWLFEHALSAEQVLGSKLK